MQPNYYKHSGKFGALALPLGLGGGILAAVLLGTIYGQAMARIPVVGKITFLIAALTGAGYGVAAAWLFRKGHGRSTTVGTIVAAIATFVGHYMAWVSWVSVVLSRSGDGPSVIDVLTNPSGMFSAISAINGVGAWSISGGAPSGGVLWALWSIEALIVLGCGIAIGAGMASTGVYCEHCNDWCKEEEGRVLLNPAPQEAVKQSLEAQQWGVLNQIGPFTGVGPCLRLDLAYCPKCEKTHAVAVSALTPKADGNGTDIDTFVQYINTSPEVSQWLRSIRQ